MQIIESSPTGKIVLDRQGTLILGISINNSYFTVVNLEKMIRWAAESSGNVIIMIPDKPSVFTFCGLGYSIERATQKARLKSNNVNNKCNAIIQQLDVSNVRILRWAEIEENKIYLNSLRQIEKAYKIGQLGFSQSVRDTTKEVLSDSGTREVTEEQIDKGVQFLFQELAFIAQADAILHKRQVAYVYHKTMPILKDAIGGMCPFKTSSGVGFITAM